MIDFRYHLVSLVSVFLALAVGIVLGAGPLKDSIGTQLTDRVESLRKEKDVLRTDLDTASAGVEHRDAFVSRVMPSLISGQLTGRSVVIVSLPGVDGDAADPVVDGITAAGGKVTGRISLGSAWVDPQQAEARAKLITKLATRLPTGAPVGDDNTDARLGYLLAGAVVSTGAGSIGQSTGADSTVLDGLRSADLIQVKGDVAGPAGGALVLAPAISVDDAGAVKATPADDAMASFVDLAVALDTVGGGAVVTGPASSATDGGVLTALRKSDGAKSRVSTVDTGSTPMGVITAVLALREQLSGSSGHYGFGSGVAEPLPALAAAAGATVSPPASKK
jgi:copper transport outer membrane protein MctB